MISLRNSSVDTISLRNSSVDTISLRIGTEYHYVALHYLKNVSGDK